MGERATAEGTPSEPSGAGTSATTDATGDATEREETRATGETNRARATEPTGAGEAHVRASRDTGSDGDLEAGAGRGSAGGGPSGVAGLVARAKDLFAWWKTTRPARALARFGEATGGVLTGGIAYAALFSVFASLTIGYTVFMAVLGGNDELREDVLVAIDSALPGIVTTGDGTGVIDPDDLQLNPGLSVASGIALVVLIVSATSCMAALRMAVRAMFGHRRGGGNLVQGKASELLGFAGMAFAVLLSAVLSIGVTTVAGWLLGAIGFEGSGRALLQALGIAVAFLVDVGTFLLVVWVLAGERPPWRDLFHGALLAATGIGVIRYLGTSVVAGSITRNPVLASFAVVVTLLIWVNLISRIVLLAAAWTADPPLVEDESADDAETAEEPAVPAS